jgi:hypothetical protein
VCASVCKCVQVKCQEQVCGGSHKREEGGVCLFKMKAKGSKRFSSKGRFEAKTGKRGGEGPVTHFWTQAESK